MELTRRGGRGGAALRVFVQLLVQQRLLKYVGLEGLLRKVVQLHRKSERLLGDRLQIKQTSYSDVHISVNIMFPSVAGRNIHKNVHFPRGSCVRVMMGKLM